MGKFQDINAEAIKERLITNKPGTSNALVWQVTKHVSSVFLGGTANRHGNDGGTNDPYTIFNVTGDVVIAGIWGICNTDLTGGSATIEVGVTGNTAALIALETATEIDDGNVYVSATQAVGVAAVAGSGAMIALNDGIDIIETTASANVTAGQIDYYVVWAPVEPDAVVVSAAAVA